MLPASAEREHIVEQYVAQLLRVGPPLGIVLFGSQARGTANPDSDIDMLIIGNYSGGGTQEQRGPSWHEAPPRRQFDRGGPSRYEVLEVGINGLPSWARRRFSHTDNPRFFNVEM